MVESTDTKGSPGQSSYDLIPYESHPYKQTHPERLAVVATLMGLKPPALEGARVLELGCAAGGNLIPMACSLPKATFLGIDLSSRQIQTGQEDVRALGLKNMELRACAIESVGEAEGPFDYIVCHGVFSWVPPPVQQKILEICKKNLAPGGIAYVSYNTYPGWHFRGMIRDMMLYHTREFRRPPVRIQQARALLDFMGESVPANEKNAYGIMLKTELELIRQSRDDYLFHEHLESENRPLYFHEFIGQASAQGLQYLGEADVGTMVAAFFPQKVLETLRKLATDIVRKEQYMDFLRNRSFRQTLLVHQGLEIKRGLSDGAAVRHFTLSSPSSEAPAGDKAKDEPAGKKTNYKAPRGGRVSTGDPQLKLAMEILMERWPAAISFDALKAQVLERAGGGAEAKLEAGLSRFLMTGFVSGAVRFGLLPDGFVPVAGEKPRTTSLILRQAARGDWVTSLRHERIVVNPFERRLLGLLDGQRDAAALIRAMQQSAPAGGGKKRKADADRQRAPIPERVPRALERFGKWALLIS